MLIKDSASIIDIIAAGCHIDRAYKYKHHKSFEDVYNNVDRFDDQFEIIQEMELYLRVWIYGGYGVNTQRHLKFQRNLN